MIETVLGAVEAPDFGVASMHEHVLSDALDDADLAAAELAVAAGLGQDAVVDLTTWGLGPRHADLPAVARAAGLHIAAGYGAYLARSHPRWLVDTPEDGLTELFHRALTGEIPGAGYRAALLGVLGTGADLHSSEARVLRAAGRAAARCGAAVAVRLDPAARLGQRVLGILSAAGTPPERVIFSNVDESMDRPYLADLAASGAVLEWCFGNEAYHRDGHRDATDAERLDGLGEFLGARVVLGCSVWTKSGLKAYGGMGYGHLLSRVVPVLRERGVPGARLTRMLVDEPRALLDR